MATVVSEGVLTANEIWPVGSIGHPRIAGGINTEPVERSKALTIEIPHLGLQ
jgi:hypothetical protein